MSGLFGDKIDKNVHFCLVIGDAALLSVVRKGGTRKNNGDEVQPGLYYYGFSATKGVQSVRGNTTIPVFRLNKACSFVRLKWCFLDMLSVGDQGWLLQKKA